MQTLCNIFPNLSLQIMKRSLFEQFLVLVKKNVFFIIIFYLYGHDSEWSVTSEQILNPVSIVGPK